MPIPLCVRRQAAALWQRMDMFMFISESAVLPKDVACQEEKKHCRAQCEYAIQSQQRVRYGFPSELRSTCDLVPCKVAGAT